MSSLMKKGPKKGKPQDGKQWLHPADLLTESEAIYAVKLLGITEVAQAKGTEVIKEAITKVQFAKHIKQSEAGKKGSKLRKVDLKISIKAIKVEDIKTKETIYSYPLHHISYCADDKRSKKVFAFIAKDKTCPQHTCYVFECEKQAEELTLTVGQAFDLAYRRYLENVGRQKLQAAESEKEGMKQKLSELENSQERARSNSSNNATTAALPDWSTPAPTTSKQDDFNLLGDVTAIPGLPPPPKSTYQDTTNTFDPFESSGSTTNGNASSHMPFDQQPVAPHTISSPFEDSPSPSPLNKVANPFEQMFEQQAKPSSTLSSDIFGESFDPLENVSSSTANTNDPFGNGQTSSPFGNGQAASPLGNGQVTSPFNNTSSVETTSGNNNIYAQPHVQRPRPTSRSNIPASLPPPPSKQSVKAAKAAAAAAAGTKVSAPTTTTPNPVAVPQTQPSTDLFSLAPEQAASPGNPFARPPDFDPFADSFDPLGMKPNQANNQMQDLQSGFSRGMALDNNDLLS